MNKERRNTKSVSSGKENENSKVNLEDLKKEIVFKCCVSVRNPLSTISDNIKLPQGKAEKKNNDQKFATIIKKKSETKNNIHFRSNSTSELEKKRIFCIPEEKINFRHDEDEDEDEVFVDGEQFFHTFLQDHNTIDKNSEGENNNGELEKKDVSNTEAHREKFEDEVFKKPARKIALVKKLSGRANRSKNEDIFFQNCLYDEEYFSDNYKHMLRTEGHTVVRKSILVKYVDYSCRLMIVNWLNCLQQKFQLSDSTFFTTIRLFDNLLIKAKISKEKYGLVGVTCMWIASKVYDSRPIFVFKLFSLCNGKFSKNQILSMEKDILKILNYKVNLPDPSVFLYFYIKRQKLQNDFKIRREAMFLLEMFTFSLEYSSSLPSLLTSAALFLALTKNNIKPDSLVNFVTRHLVEERYFKHFAGQMMLCVKEIYNCKCFDNEVIAKYSVQLNITEQFFTY